MFDRPCITWTAGSVPCPGQPELADKGEKFSMVFGMLSPASGAMVNEVTPSKQTTGAASVPAARPKLIQLSLHPAFAAFRV